MYLQDKEREVIKMKITAKEYNEISNTVLNFISTSIVEENNLKHYDDFINFTEVEELDALIKELKNISKEIHKRINIETTIKTDINSVLEKNNFKGDVFKLLTSIAFENIKKQGITKLQAENDRRVKSSIIFLYLPIDKSKKVC